MARANSRILLENEFAPISEIGLFYYWLLLVNVYNNGRNIKNTEKGDWMEHIKVTIGNQVYENAERIEFYAGLGNEVGFTVFEKEIRGNCQLCVD